MESTEAWRQQKAPNVSKNSSNNNKKASAVRNSAVPKPRTTVHSKPHFRLMTEIPSDCKSEQRGFGSHGILSSEVIRGADIQAPLIHSHRHKPPHTDLSCRLHLLTPYARPADVQTIPKSDRAGARSRRLDTASSGRPNLLLPVSTYPSPCGMITKVGL